MRTLPPEPNPGDKISASLIRELIRAIRERTPIAGHGMKVSIGPNGSVISSDLKISQKEASTHYLQPWTLVSKTDSVSGESYLDWERKIIQVGYSLYDYGSDLYSEHYSDETGGEDGFYFLKLTFDPENFNTVPDAEMVCVDEAPENDWENHVHYVYIGQVEDGVQKQGTHVVPIIYMYI